MILVPVLLVTVSAHLNCLADALLGSEGVSMYKRGDFSYESRNPEIWGTISSNYTLCKEGKYQSPINFEDEGMLGEKKFEENWSDFVTGAIIGNAEGHATKVELPKGSTSSILPFDTKESYKLLQFHFHVPSEHHREEEGFPIEVHFVHATPNKDLAVVGFWFYLSETSTPFLNAVLDKGFPKHEEVNIPLDTIDFRSVKDNIRSSKFWSYDGSLTTPPCSEGVKWAVSDTPLPISIKHYEGLRKSMKFGARPTQKNASKVKGSEAKDHSGHGEAKEHTSHKVIKSNVGLGEPFGSSLESGSSELFSLFGTLVAFSIMF
ncbi:alpha carbonic anhydrase [Globomyces pollinis-pini]|nr:alpha carbonic anhydrase [Globomyces pollinis-pini]